MEPTLEQLQNAQPSAAQLAAEEQRRAAKQAANADPLPGPLLDAFDAEPVRAAGLVLQPVVPYHLTILKRINSPLHRMLLEAAKPAEERAQPGFEDEEVYEMIFVFSRPVREVRAALARGRDDFRETALRAVADGLPLATVAQLEAAVVENFTRAYLTFIGYEDKPSEDGKSFTRPLPAATTGLAGGCNSSVVSPASPGTP